MKTKIILSFWCIIGCASNTFGQYGYAGINLGYGMGLPTNSIGASTKADFTGTTYTLEKGTFGQGLNIGISGGFMFNENIGAELGISYLMGSKKDFNTSTYSMDTSSFSISQTNGTVTLDKIKMIRINPALKITFGDEVKPYIRFGVILGLGTGYSRTDESTTMTTGLFGDTVSLQSVIEYSGGSSFGFNSAVGVDFTLSDNLVLFGELSFTSLSWSPTKGTITKLIYDGIDQTALAIAGSLEAEYVDSYTKLNITGIPGVPTSNQSLKTYLPFSSFGINVGVMFTFGK